MLSKYLYVDVDDVYRTSGLRDEVISREDVQRQIERAEVFTCRFTKNIYYKHNLEDEAVTTVSNNDNDLIASTEWLVDEWKNQYVVITSGTGKGQHRKILSNTATTLVVNRDWEINPDLTSSFSIFYVPPSFNPYKDLTGDDSLTGNGRKDLVLPFYPLNELESLEIADVEVSISSVYKHKPIGKIELSTSSEYQIFSATYPQQVKIKYWYGVPSITDDVKRFTEIRAALAILQQQMGGTFDVPSTFSLPDLNVSIGQAYVNIRGTVDVLQKEYDELKKNIRVYPVFA
jgi:hypothetical protein